MAAFLYKENPVFDAGMFFVRWMGTVLAALPAALGGMGRLGGVGRKKSLVSV